MKRTLLIGAIVGVAVAAVLKRRRAGAASPAAPVVEPAARQPAPPEPAPPEPAVQEPAPAAHEAAAPEPAAPEPAASPEPATTSAVSPAATTVRETHEDLLSGLREPAPDHEVEREVEAQLAASPLPAEEVSVEVRDHIAQLEGTVPDPEVADLIGDEAAHVDGVQGLDNRLRPERETAVEESRED